MAVTMKSACQQMQISGNYNLNLFHLINIASVSFVSLACYSIVAAVRRSPIRLHLRWLMLHRLLCMLTTAAKCSLRPFSCLSLGERKKDVEITWKKWITQELLSSALPLAKSHEIAVLHIWLPVLPGGQVQVQEFKGESEFAWEYSIAGGRFFLEKGVHLVYGWFMWTRRETFEQILQTSPGVVAFRLHSNIPS